MKTRIVGMTGLVLAVILAIPAAAEPADKLLGEWMVADKDTKITIYKKDGKYHGKITWLLNPTYAAEDPEAGKTLRDRNNPDPARQNDPLLNLNLIRDFVFDGENSWSGGTIYDPQSGKLYSCTMTMPDDKTLNVRGYIGVPTFGRTEVWTRPEPEPVTAPPAGEAEKK